MTRDTYTVNANRWEHGWELHIAGPDGYEGASQAHGLKSAEKMARDYIALDREIDSDSFDVVIKPIVGGFLGELIKDAKTALHLLAEATTAAADKSRQAVAKLHEDGMTQTEIADVLKISQQRVSQLLEEGRRPKKTERKHPAAAGARKKVGHG